MVMKFKDKRDTIYFTKACWKVKTKQSQQEG